MKNVTVKPTKDQNETVQSGPATVPLRTESALHGSRPMSMRRELLLFLLIPMTSIGFMAILLWLPSIFAKPKYDFMYTSCPSYDCTATFAVKNGVVSSVMESTYGTNLPDINFRRAKLYYYRVGSGSAQEIDETQAAAYAVSAQSVSPDGYRLEQGHDANGSGFLFWGGTGGNKWYVKNGLKRKQVNLSSDSPYSWNNIKFIGWVEK